MGTDNSDSHYTGTVKHTNNEVLETDNYYSHYKGAVKHTYNEVLETKILIPTTEVQPNILI
jgi:hypothetical protein